MHELFINDHSKPWIWKDVILGILSGDEMKNIPISVGVDSHVSSIRKMINLHSVEEGKKRGLTDWMG